MAKHAKKNNIISYDEAKHKKLQEKEKYRKRAAKHFREDYSQNESSNSDSLDNDAQINAEDTGYHDYNQLNEDTDAYENDDLNEIRGRRFERRGGEYPKEREPLPRNLVNLILVASMTVLLLVLIVMFLKYYVVEDINVIGNESVKYHDITQLCGVEYKQSMLSVKKEDIIESFESKSPMIEVVEVKKIWPNILEIHVKERPPICYIVLKGSQKCALIGEGNVCLSIVESYLEGDIPRIYGLDVGSGELGKEIMDGETRKLEVLKLLISSMIETNCISEIKSININNTTNITMVSTSEIQIKAGDTSRLVEKFSVIKLAIYKLVSENNTNVTLVVTGDNTFYTE